MARRAVGPKYLGRGDDGDLSVQRGGLCCRERIRDSTSFSADGIAPIEFSMLSKR